MSPGGDAEVGGKGPVSPPGIRRRHRHDAREVVNRLRQGDELPAHAVADDEEAMFGMGLLRVSDRCRQVLFAPIS